jgi:DNA-binding transcriptional LysR family regulator
VELSLGTSFSDLALEDIDVAIRIGRLRDSALRARRLGRVPRTLVAASSYLKRAGCPETPAELSSHEFLGYLPPRGDYALRMKTAEGAPREVRVPTPRFTVNSIATLVRLVEAGQGIFFGPLWAFAESLERGRVRRLLPEMEFDAYPVHALYRERHYLPAKTRVFVDAMVEHVGRQPGLEGVGVT